MKNPKPQTNPELVKKICRRIFAFRKVKGISREELAFKIGISPQQLFKYEMGQNRISVDRLINIAKVLDLKVISFIPVEDVGYMFSFSNLNNKDDDKILEDFVKLKKLPYEDVVGKLVNLLSLDLMK